MGGRVNLLTPKAMTLVTFLHYYLDQLLSIVCKYFVVNKARNF